MLLRNKPRVVQEDVSTIVYDYKKFTPLLGRKKRALLSYIIEPILLEEKGEKIVRFSNFGLALSWARVLNELGFVVDIINWDDKNSIIRDDYDLIVLHGAKNYKHILNSIKNKPKIIHFLTGSYWQFNNTQEDKRIANFYKRHGVRVKRDRYIYHSEDEVNEKSDLIIVLGDESMKDTYPNHYKNIVTINNGTYPDDFFDEHKKDYKIAKKRFLYFAGSGNIHKGLDVLIDSFKGLDEELYIVGHLDKEVISVYKDTLSQPNYHLIGEVNMRSPEFYDAMSSCAFAILPSCSEGQAGSVVECMNQGLIPIVSKETRLDTSGYGFTLMKSSIPEIRAMIIKLSKMSDKDVATLSRKTRKVAITEYYPENFRQKLKLYLSNFLDK